MATLEKQVHVHDMYILFCICILLGCMAIKGRYMYVTCTYCFVSCILLTNQGIADLLQCAGVIFFNQK